MLTVSACNPNKRSVIDPATLQTPATAAVLRYIIDHCPQRKEAEFAVLGIGENLGQPRPDFVEQFKDVKGIEFLDHQRVVAGMVNGKSRRFDQQTNKPVLELQIGSITEAVNGRQEAVAAWAFKDDAERRRLEVKEKTGGGYEVRELEKIPIPNRNDDRRNPGN